MLMDSGCGAVGRQLVWVHELETHRDTASGANRFQCFFSICMNTTRRSTTCMRPQDVSASSCLVTKPSPN